VSCAWCSAQARRQIEQSERGSEFPNTMVACRTVAAPGALGDASRCGPCMHPDLSGPATISARFVVRFSPHPRVCPTSSFKHHRQNLLAAVSPPALAPLPCRPWGFWIYRFPVSRRRPISSEASGRGADRVHGKPCTRNNNAVADTGPPMAKAASSLLLAVCWLASLVEIPRPPP